MALLARKKGKKLLAQLFELQKDDVDITVPTFISIKFYLKDRPRCNNVQVSPSGDRSSLGIIDRAHLPRFILSQLEAQGVADEETEAVQLHPVLSFILLSLPARPVKRTACFPTLFCWHCCRTRRTRLLFGYLDVDMPSRTYTPAELLALRASRSIQGILTAGRNDPELASIIVAPRERPVNTLGTASSASTMRPAQKNSKDDSSTESDEVVFKRRLERQFPMIDPAWKLRGRGGSETAAATEQQLDKQPANAPGEITSQHHEGFQRFYKTVVSPTHVRVTAGGRIVPNTRGIPSPTIKRPRDKSAFETSKADGSPAQTRTTLPPSADSDAALKTQQASQSQMHLPPPLFASFPPNSFASPVPGSPMQLMAPPMVPVNLPYGAYHQQPPRPSQGSRNPQASPKGPLQELQARKDENEASRQQSGSQQSEAAKGPKISPVEQLDLTKPYIVNGQLFYPVPSGSFAPAMGVPMVAGIPGFAPLHPQVAGMMPHHLPLHPMFGGMGFPGAPGTIPGIVPGAVSPALQQQPQQRERGQPQQSQSGSFSLRPPSAPPISSIKPSEITKKQIESLKANLKYHEDQLLFNKHQVDEKEMEKMVEMLRGEIKLFEMKKERQVAHELQHYPKQESSSESTKADAGPASQPLRSSSGQTSLPDQQKVAAALEGARKPGSLRKRESSRLKSEIIGTRSSGLPFDSPDSKCGAGAAEPLRSSVLPSAAALAPPFEPRSGHAFEAPTQRSLDNSLAALELSDEARKASMERLLSAGAGAWDQFEGTGKPENKALTTARSSKDSTKKLGTTSSMSSQDKPRYELPYLIGTLPPGTDTRTAHDTDYKYPRALTDAENRARYLYWSNAPAKYRAGLPKYDGRNFYRASPPATESSETAIDASHTGSAQREPSTSTDSGLSFNKPAAVRDPFRPSTPTERTPQARSADSPISAKIANMTQKLGNLGMDEVALNTGKRLQDRASAQSARLPDADVRSIDSLDKRSSERHGARLLQAMLKRGANRSSEALPGAVTSTNAHGYVPPFGFSTFSMAPPTMGPIVAHPSGSPALSTPSKSSDKNIGMLAPAVERQAENRPPLGQASLEEQFRRMVSGETKQQTSSSIPMDGRGQDDW